MPYRDEIEERRTPAGGKPEKTKKTGADPPNDRRRTGCGDWDRRDHHGCARDKETYGEETGRSGGCGGSGVCECKFLTPNEYSRPQIPLEKVNGIVVHYVANPCSTALENRNYFEGLKDQTGSKTTSVSSHFVIGLEGEVVQCVPLNEVAYASNNRNSDTISIECCHPDETGKFYDSTYQTLVNLCAYLCVKFDLKPDDVIRHYDVTGKICPKYFVDYPEKWEDFHKDVKKAIKILKK